MIVLVRMDFSLIITMAGPQILQVSFSCLKSERFDVHFARPCALLFCHGAPLFQAGSRS